MFSVLFQRLILIFTVIHYNVMFIDCVVPALSVQKVNSKLIERKRQDTLEICRLFNEENIRQQITNNTHNLQNNNSYPTKQRIKRDIDSNKFDNSILKQEDILRVEKIVDKIYDDFEENGNYVSYRKRNLQNVTKITQRNKPNRRFNFAPAQLLGQSEENVPPKVLSSGSVKIPWIKKWKHGIVPYFIDPNTYDAHLSDVILKVFDYIEKVSCIRLQRLREKPTDKRSMQTVEWLYITNPSGIRQCVHSNERKPNTGVQMVVLGYDCLSQGEIAHEVMHVLGFSHEHTRSDRDRFITILWDNIKPGYKKYFEARHDDHLINLPYDFASVLHYPPRAFSKNGQVTIMAESGIKIGQRETLSEIDIEKIGMIYGVECVERNKDYLLKTCPSVVKTNPAAIEIAPNDIKDYFEGRVWPYGIINYQIKDKMEFTAEERENLKSVFNHIEKETCIEFRDINDQTDVDETDGSIEDTSTKPENENGKPDSEITSETNLKHTKHITDAINATMFESSKKQKMTIKFKSIKYNLSETTSQGNLRTSKRRNTYNKSVHSYGTPRAFNKEIFKYNNNKRQKANKTTMNAHSEPLNTSIHPKSPERRHAADIIMLARSSKPGCNCPPPGRPNGNKVITINADCFDSVNNLLHLFVHLLGLDHQHNMHDRDSFLHIVWDNLTSDIRDEMNNKLPAAASAGYAYDYQSVMHYPWLQIKDGITNIMYPIWKDGWAMGHWQGLSSADVQKLNLIYMDECNKRKQHTRKVHSNI